MNDQNATPDISVILSVYNTAPFLRQCLNSILSQTLSNIEIICVDDSSDDGSDEILQEYALADKRVTVIRQEHAGAGKARNTGLAIAKGKYLSILDSDDFFEPDMLECAFKAAEANDAQIVVFRADFFDQNTYNLEPCTYSIIPSMLPENNPFSAGDVSDRIFNIGCGWAWDKLFRRSFVEESNIRFQEIRTSNDMLFVFYLYSRAERIYFLDRLLVHQRIHASRSLSVTRERSWNNFYLALTALQDRLKADGSYETFRHSFVNWALNFSLWHIDTLPEMYSKRLISKCRNEYFNRLDIPYHEKDYYINPTEYERMLRIMSVENNSKVSVIVPVYNGSKYLRMCLNSICAQTLEDIQIICVDDNSADDSLSILKEYEEKDPRVIVIHKDTHTNAGDSRNTGMEFADGEYLSFLDADDFFEPEMLEKAYNAAVNDNAEIVAFRCNQYDDRAQVFRDCPWTLKLHEMPEQRPFSGRDCAEHIFTMTSCTAWDKLFSREFITREEISFQDVSSCNDMLFTFSAYSAASSITTLDEVLVHQRVGQVKYYSRDIEYLWHNFYDALSGLKSFLIYRGTYDIYKKSFVNWAIDFSIWNMHNYHDYFRDLIRQSLKNSFFEELDISTSPREDFFNQGLYDEMAAIMAEKQPIDENAAPKVSILIPTYNVEQYMRICLDSAVNQTLQEIEIIVINDGSTDNCLEIVKEYAERDPRIRIIDKENGGYGKAMNCGYDIATGEYIGIIEPDDYVDLHMYEDLYNLAKEKDLDFIKADFNRFQHDEYGNLIFMYNKIAKLDENYNVVIKPSEVKSSFTYIMNTWSGIYKHSFLEEHKIRHNETPGASFQDNGFWFQTMMFAERAMFYNKPYYCNRRDNPNSSVASREKVYCMNEEYAYLRKLLLSHEDKAKELMAQLHWKKYHNYLFRYDVIAPEYQEEYIKRMADEFREAIENNELDESVFEDFEIDEIHWMIDDPHDYYINNNSTVPAVSVIIPVYNTSEFLRQCLDSVLGQTLSNIEVICVDDGSTDGSIEILKEYEQKDSRVKLIFQENAGGGAARNKGIAVARGKYLSFLDSDDFFEPRMLEEAYNKCRRVGADICVYKVRRYDNVTGNFSSDRGSFVEANFPSKASGIEVFSSEDMGDRVFNTFQTWPWNKLFSRRFIMKHELRFQEIMRTNDMYFVNSALMYADRITVVRIELVNYRVGTVNNCQATNDQAPTDFHKALCALYDEIMKDPTENRIRSFSNLYVRSCNYNLNSVFAKSAEAYAYLYRFLHSEGFDRIDPATLDEGCITADNKAAYKECSLVRKFTFEEYMVDKLSYNREQVKKLTNDMSKLRRDMENLKRQKNELLGLSSKELDELKADRKKLEDMRKTLKKFL